MPVMEIGFMRMRMGDYLMGMEMSMFSGTGERGMRSNMVMSMMEIFVPVPMIMHQGEVLMHMGMFFGNQQPGTKNHDRKSNQ